MAGENGTNVALHHEVLAERTAHMATLHAAIADHYVTPASRLVIKTRPKLEALVAQLVPTQKRIQSGDLAEILASEYTEPELGFHLPAKRLRGKEDRNQSMRGDDLIAVRLDTAGALAGVLKGEVKSRQQWSLAAVKEACAQLDRADGRPKPSTVGFLVQRAALEGNAPMVDVLMQLLEEDADQIPVEHAVFLLFGKVEDDKLSDEILASAHGFPRRVVGLVTKDHAGLCAMAMSTEELVKAGVNVSSK